MPDALETPGVCSNYRVDLCSKTYQCARDFKEGNAIFTFPNTPVKCAGAPQKIMYITDYNLRQMGKRDKAHVMYHSSLAVLFGVKKYADSLWEVVKEKNIDVNLRSNLIQVKPDSKEAVFQNLDKPEETIVRFFFPGRHSFGLKLFKGKSQIRQIRIFYIFSVQNFVNFF